MMFWRKSVVWQLLLPVPIAAILLVCAWLWLPGMVRTNVVSATVSSAQQIVNQFKTLRAYYTKNIIKKVLADGDLRPSFNHQQENDGIPLPATLIHDMSQLLAEQDTKIKLYSAFPFPNRSNRQLDDFQRQAWRALSQSPDEVFVREVRQDGARRVRVAVADEMVAQVCVDCHNSHSTSPKTDWQLGDVRGVLEVDTLIEGPLAAGEQLTHTILLAGLVGGGLLAGLIALVARRATRSLQTMTTAIDDLAQGDQEISNLQTERQDEIGAMSRALVTLRLVCIDAIRAKTAMDAASTCFLIAKRHQNAIVYVNGALKQVLRQAEVDFRGSPADISADSLMGRNLQEILACGVLEGGETINLSEPQVSRIGFGKRTFNLTTTPIIAANGTRFGTACEWQDLTDEIRAEQEVEELVAAAATGDFSRRLDLDGKVGFMRKLAEDTNQLTGLVDRATGDLANMLAALAKGELDHRIEADYQGKFGELKGNANTTAEQLSEIMSQIQVATGEVGSAAAEINSGTDDLSKRTEQAASNLEETAAATEEMAATVKQNADNAKNANQLAGSANQIARQGGKVVERAVDAMDRIEQSAQKITDIIGVIDEITFQTNLLALNASVEAARAGESGKGFAVVAQELRQLAQRSAQAASDIKTLIQDSNGQVKDGVQLVNRAGEALTEIVDSIAKVDEIVREISSASQEQAAGVQEINASVTSMDEMTQQNSALVEESTASARALGDQAGKLTQLIAFFKFDGSAASHRAHPTMSQRPSDLMSPRSTPKAVAKQPTMNQPAVATADHDGWSEF